MIEDFAERLEIACVSQFIDSNDFELFSFEKFANDGRTDKSCGSGDEYRFLAGRIT